MVRGPRPPHNKDVCGHAPPNWEYLIAYNEFVKLLTRLYSNFYLALHITSSLQFDL